MSQSDDQPRVDVVVVRDPDYETSISVFVNGVLWPAHEWHVDPGAGYTSDDWECNRIEAVEAAPYPVLKELLDSLYEDYRDSDYID